MMWLNYLLYSGITIIIALGLSIVLFFFLKKRGTAQLYQSLEMCLFSVKMPRYEKKEPGEKKDINAVIELMERIYANFLYLQKPSFFKRIFYGPCRVALEIASEVGGEDIVFYIAVPSYIESALEKSIHGVYSEAVIEKASKDYTIFEPNGMVAGARLFLKKAVYFPINTYKNLEGDPLSAIVNGLSKIKPQEGAAVQIILRPSSSDIKKSGERLLSKIIEEGKDVKSALVHVGKSKTFNLASDFYETLAASKEDKKEAERARQMKMQKEGTVNEDAVAAIRAKIRKPILEANIRLIGVSKDKSRAEEILMHLSGAFFQFASVFNEFQIAKVKKRGLKKFIYNFSFRNFYKRERVILNLEEITSLYHFPLPHLDSPQLKWAKSKEATLPTELAATGVNSIGNAFFRGEEKPVYFASREDRRRHFYIIGQTGTGKSTLLREMIRQDIEQGEGVGVIDPHGELIEYTLANIPKQRAEDVILFEPFDTNRPTGLNMLEYKSPEQKDFAISEMMVIFSKLFPPEIIGPMFEHYMRNAMLALMADQSNPGTLVDIPRIFTDKEFMQTRLEKVTDPLVKTFWLKEWAGATGQTKSDMLGYVVSKVGRFVENETMRNIIGQVKNAFDLETIMDEKKILLANLSKGLTGELNSSLLGLILVSKMQIAALRRGGIPENQRNDFYLYIDEFQNFTTNSVATILSEARKYRLNLILAHQFMPQLTEEIRNAVVGNVGSIACFRVGAQDAEFLEKQFEPEFSRFDLLNLDNFQFIAKMMIRNNISSPFKVKTNKSKEGNIEMIAPIKQLSKLKYGRPKAVVEAEIMERLKL